MVHSISGFQIENLVAVVETRREKFAFHREWSVETGGCNVVEVRLSPSITSSLSFRTSVRQRRVTVINGSG